MPKQISKYSLLCFIAAVLFAVTAIANTISGDSNLFMLTLPWVSAIAFAMIGFRELARK